MVSSECRSAVNNVSHCGTDKHRSRTSQRTAWLFGAIRPFISIPLPVLYAESVKTTTEAEAGTEGATLSYLSATLNSHSPPLLSPSPMDAAMRCLWGYGTHKNSIRPRMPRQAVRNGSGPDISAATCLFLFSRLRLCPAFLPSFSRSLRRWIKFGENRPPSPSQYH